MDNQTILVVMPVYNAERTLKKAIDSILNQTYTNLHLVAVDDCSTDDSLEILKEYSDNKRVTVVRNSENFGAYYSRNIGLYKFRNQQWGFFTTHDADDISNPNRFEMMHRHFNNNRTNGVQDTWERLRLSNKKSIKVSLTCAHAMFRRQVFNDLGYFDMMRFGADWEHWARLTAFNKINNQITRSINETMGHSYVAKSNLTETIPENSGPRQRYVESARKDHARMSHSKNFYRSFTPKSRAKKVDMSLEVAPITAGAEAAAVKTPKYNNVRITVVLLTWKRIANLKKTLQMLAAQTFDNFEVQISNGNMTHAKNVDNYAKLFSDRLKIRVSHDGNDIFSFRRMTVGKRLAQEGTDIILFIDDDIVFDERYVETCLRYYEPESYKSGYAWSFQDGGSDYYSKRTRIHDLSSKIHYCGTGISIIDASIFLQDGLISRAPEEAYKIEDLWLSYYAQKVMGWQLGYVPMSNVVIGGADGVALHKAIIADKKSASNAVDKADFLRKLVKEYRWKL